MRAAMETDQPMSEITSIEWAKSIVQLNAEGVMIRAQAETWLKEHFGDRCLGFEPGCECCKRWAALDALFEEA